MEAKGWKRRDEMKGWRQRDGDEEMEMKRWR